jgi:serine protease inhibitor
MWVLLPVGSGQPLDLLAPATMTQVGKAMRPKRVDLSLPRWDFGKDDQIALETVLPRLGMTLPFEPGRADFSGMTDMKKLYIAQAVHRANITVDEDGTEAAAVTGIAIEPVSAKPGPEVTVRADHPFAFAVVHKPTGAPLFIGQVADPTQK